MKSVLVTGGAGFIGSNFVKLIVKNHTDWLVVNVDSLTYAGSTDNLKELDGNRNHVFIKGDITDSAHMQELFGKYNFDCVINFAAQTHVDRSIIDPGVFVKTNVLGTQCLLDCAKNAWQTGSDEHGCPAYRQGVKFLQISTDEVYGPAGEDERFCEDSPLAPSSPYAASKASADLLVRAYGVTYKLPFNISRSSNNYGPGQHTEKLIPLAIKNALDDAPIPVYGDGLQKRDWIHVSDNCGAIEAVLLSGRPAGEIYNIGSGGERTNLDVILQILKALGKPETLIDHVQDRLGHDRRYALDTSKIVQELGWKPRYRFESGIAETAAWYKDNARSLGQ